MPAKNENTDLKTNLLALYNAQQIPGLVFPLGKTDIFSPEKTNWNLNLLIKNSVTTNRDITCAIFTGNLSTKRSVLVSPSGTIPAIGGGLINVNPIAAPAGISLQINDNPEQINLHSNLIVDAVINQELSPTISNAIEQTIYANATGAVTVSTKQNNFEFYKKFIERNAIRLHEIQLSTDNPNVAFGSSLKIKHLNPFENTSIKLINFEDYYKPENYLATKIIVPVDEYIDNRTLMTFVVPRGRFNITFKFSAYYADAVLLKEKLKTQNLLQNIKSFI